MNNRIFASLPPPSIAAIFVMLMLAYHGIFGFYFPLPSGLIGHDYALVLPGFMDGYLWFRNNGFLTPPWFSPSFCGGQIFFPDPQSSFYSVPQFLSFITDPLTAAYTAMLLFAALGFWGMYLLARRTFGLSQAAALIAATVFMFNGFYSHRLIVGHYVYQSFMLVPWLAWLLSRPNNPIRFKQDFVLAVVLSGLLLAYWMQAGLTTLIIPSGLSVFSLICIAEMRTGESLIKRAFLRGFPATLLALALSASKLVAGITLMSQFPRTYYPLPGIEDPIGLMKFVLHALFYSSQHAYETVTPLWKNMQWAAMPHELAFGLTFIPLIIILVGLLMRMRELRQHPIPRPKLIPLATLFAILTIPFALLYYTPEWNEVLKRIPIVGSTTSPARWLIILIPAISLLAGMVTNHTRMQKWIALLVVIGVPALNAMENRDYYAQQNYDPKPVTDFYQAIKKGSVQPEIKQVEDRRTESGGIIIDNVAFTRGATSLYCYNPLFGYRLEKYHPEPLQAGPVNLTTLPGHLNLRNPACLLSPKENNCRPWDTFRTEQQGELLQFARYRPFNFKQSRRQELANLLSEFALALSLIALIGLCLFRSRWRNGKATTKN